MSDGWNWRQHAADVRAAEQRLGEGHRRGGKMGPGYDDALAAWRNAVALAWPPTFLEALEGLKRGDSSGVAQVLGFLEADAVFFRSGYIAEKALRWIKRVALSRHEQERLRAVVLDAVERRHRQYFRRFCSLARRLDTPAFREQLAQRLGSPDPQVVQHARWVLDAMEQK